LFFPGKVVNRSKREMFYSVRLSATGLIGGTNEFFYFSVDAGFASGSSNCTESNRLGQGRL